MDQKKIMRKKVYADCWLPRLLVVFYLFTHYLKVAIRKQNKETKKPKQTRENKKNKENISE